MKVVYRNSWATKLGGAILASFLAVPAYAQLMLAHEGHHDAGGCTIKTGEFPVTFSAYEVPEGGIPPMHSFCENLPNTGKVNLTIELPHEARQIPLAVRLVKEGHEGHGGEKHSTVADQKLSVDTKDHTDHEGMNHDEHAGHEASEHGIVYMPPEVHNSGIIVVAANIQEKGQYAIQLEKKDDAGNVKTIVRIPLNVGKGGGHGSHGGGFGMMEIALAVIVVGGAAAFYFIRRKKASGTAA
jgi:hypothetical protein